MIVLTKEIEPKVEEGRVTKITGPLSLQYDVVKISVVDFSKRLPLTREYILYV